MKLDIRNLLFSMCMVFLFSNQFLLDTHETHRLGHKYNSCICYLRQKFVYIFHLGNMHIYKMKEFYFYQQLGL